MTIDYSAETWRTPGESPRIEAPSLQTNTTVSPPPKALAEIHARVVEGQIPEHHTDCDAFTMYLREIGRTSLLTLAEESELARKIKAGDSKAREQMIQANLRLVVKIARDFEHCGLPLLDLVSEGNIGLMKAVERFDSRKGAKLSTYAAFWIKQSIRRALANQARTIRLPVHVLDKLMVIRRAQSVSWADKGRESTDKELSGKLHISERRIGAYREASLAPSSLDALINESAVHTYSDIVPDENGFSPYEQLAAKTEAHIVRELIGTLNPRERGILEARFGLADREPQTLDVIGKTFGLTRERIRQIQEVALAKLRRGLNNLNPAQPATA